MFLLIVFIADYQLIETGFRMDLSRLDQTPISMSEPLHFDEVFTFQVI
jgi:hypothetical protein